MNDDWEELLYIFRRGVRLIFEGEDVPGTHRVEPSNYYSFAHNGERKPKHVFYAGDSGFKYITDGEVKQIEYPHLEYMIEGLGIDTSDPMQVIKHVAIHEAAHMIECEFGGGQPSYHEEDYETILIDLLDKHWDVV